MNAGFILKAWSARLLAFVLALAGLVPVLAFVAASFLPAAVLTPLLSRLPGAASLWWMAPEARLPAAEGLWLVGAVHPAIFFALLGLGFMALADFIAKRQVLRLQAAERYREDRMRRVRQYREVEREEPFFGHSEEGAVEQAERRVA